MISSTVAVVATITAISGTAKVATSISVLHGDSYWTIMVATVATTSAERAAITNSTSEIGTTVTRHSSSPDAHPCLSLPSFTFRRATAKCARSDSSGEARLIAGTHDYIQ